MKLQSLSPQKSINKAFFKQKPLRSEIELFKINLIRLLNKVDEIEREENQKNHVRDFLRDTYYKDFYEINTKDNKDLVIHLGKTNKDKVGVIIEAKRPGNRAEMLTMDKPNVKALHELVLYYLHERIEEDNIDIKYLIATNVYEWYIFEASVFEKLFYRNKPFVKQYEQWRDGQKVSKDTSLFYIDIAKPFIERLEEEIVCSYIDLRDYESIVRNADPSDDKKLIALQKILSPVHLLRVPFANDSNSLNDKFYRELLHIIGLEEVKEGSKSVIRRKKEKRQTGSLLENTINILETDDALRRVRDKAAYGDNKEEQLFNIALELCLTWINRVLFLKLLEGQLLTYHKGNKDFLFLNCGMIQDFDELYKLFHQVLARKHEDRSGAIRDKFSKVPYLNSSLFEITDLEAITIKINALDDSEKLEILPLGVLREERKVNLAVPTLQYLFQFLDAYDFSSEGGEDIAEDNKSLINASVLGKVFEKINGYKDGSIFTPGFITMYMSRQALRPAVIRKFNDYFKDFNIAKAETFEDLYNRIDKLDISSANQVVNSLKICDPAVGSGHFLVSALNEMILIKAELGILADKNGKRLRDYDFTIENDELIITSESGLFVYNHQNKESQRVQETIFTERQLIIENCLFGVDINPNSVKICRLRLWIELLKSSYYKSPDFQELETLPNIDINIKCGNSLISRYALDADIRKALKRSRWNIHDYQLAVMSYRNARSKDEKRNMEELIASIKNDFETEVQTSDKRFERLSKAKGELFNLTNQGSFFEKSKKELAEWNKKISALTATINKLEQEIEEIRNNAIYRNAFEWRFEFPEVLNDEGDFVGFDVVIGNPPYIRQEEIINQKNYFKENYKTFSGTADLYVFFIEKTFEILTKYGKISLIVPNKWMKAGYGKALRSYLLQNQLNSLIDFGDNQIFTGVTTYPCIINCSNVKTSGTYMSLIIKNLQFVNGFEHYVNSFSNEMAISELSYENWIITSEIDQNLIRKIKQSFTCLSDYVQSNSFRGILTGLTEAFVIDTETRIRLIEEDKNSQNLIKPFLLGREIKPYISSLANNWIILIPKGFTIKRNLPADNINYICEPTPRYGSMEYDIAWKWFKMNYPAIAGYLLPFKDKAELRIDKGDFWWELRACDYYNLFETPKIMYQVFQVKPCFIYDDYGQYCNNSMWIIPKNDKFLVGILNSKMGWWLISKHCSAIQNGFQLIWKYFGQIPIPSQNIGKEPLTVIVDQILQAKKEGKDTTALERRVDEMVYKLYDLSYNEVMVIDPQFWLNEAEYEAITLSNE